MTTHMSSQRSEFDIELLEVYLATAIAVEEMKDLHVCGHGVQTWCMDMVYRHGVWTWCMDI